MLNLGELPTDGCRTRTAPVFPVSSQPSRSSCGLRIALLRTSLRGSEDRIRQSAFAIRFLVLPLTRRTRRGGRLPRYIGASSASGSTKGPHYPTPKTDEGGGMASGTKKIVGLPAKNRRLGTVYLCRMHFSSSGSSGFWRDGSVGGLVSRCEARSIPRSLVCEVERRRHVSPRWVLRRDPDEPLRNPTRRPLSDLLLRTLFICTALVG